MSSLRHRIAAHVRLAYAEEHIEHLRCQLLDAEQRARFLALALEDIRNNAMPPMLYVTAPGQRIHRIVADALHSYERSR